MIETIRKNAGWCLLLLLVVMFIPWLGETLFNTKGEPREAIVAMSMLDSGNLILPESFGCEIPYKPPFLAWCIAVCSFITGGLNEFASRLPSAIALIALAFATYRFFYRWGGCRRNAFVTAIVMVTTVEVWRAGSACRVDMLLTACMVGAIYSLYGFFENRRRWLPWLAILLMSGAFLTKGPVGVFLPCLVIGVYRLIVGDRFWPLFGRLAASGALACVIPALWYIAAYNQGGDRFLSLVIEENFGRLTGTMSYDSHVNPWWYNIITVVAGMAPYTLLAFLAVFTLRKSKLKVRSVTLYSVWQRMRAMNPAVLFSIVTVVIIFVFYCIPKSKRSVYLLPIYPFLAYFVTLLIFRMFDKSRKLFNMYSRLIAIIAIMLPIVAGLMLPGMVGVIPAVVAVSCFLVGLYAFKMVVCADRKRSTAAMLFATVMIFTTLSSAVLPPILSSKSQKPVADQLMADYPQGDIYSFMNVPMLRFYEVNFYMGDRIRVFDEDFPETGLVIVNEYDRDALIEKFGDRYEFTSVEDYSIAPPLFSKPHGLTTHLLSFSRRGTDDAATTDQSQSE